MGEAHQYVGGRPVAVAGVEARATFISRTYAHLFGAIALFTIIEVAIFSSAELVESIARPLLGTSWLIVLGAFMVVGWLASHTAHHARSLAAQYAALGAYVLAQSLIFVPLLFLAFHHAPGAISSAAIVTLGGFAGLTMIAFMTRKDFSALRGFLAWGGVSALLLIVASGIWGFNIGTWFSVGMIAFAGAAILYDTSNVIHHYSEDRYVAAALELFASVALLFWYVLRFFSSSRD